jgi:hypothetical protein
MAYGPFEAAQGIVAAYAGDGLFSPKLEGL